jgi:predicted MFS family arabinose efflux permease
MKAISSTDSISSPPKHYSRFQTALRALQHRNYRLFFGGQLISLIGTWMQMVAQPWLVYRKTGSSLLLGSVGFASQIPVFLLAFIGGSIADRYNRHKLVIGTQAAAMVLAFILAVLTLTDAIKIWHIFVLSALLGVVNAIDMPVRQAFTVELVGKEDLMSAIALNSSLFNGARVLGPAVAGVLISSIGDGWCFFGNAVSYIAVIIGLLMMKMQPRTEQSQPSSSLRNVLKGFQYVRRTKLIRVLLVLLAVVSIVGMPYSVLMPIFADKILHGGPKAMGTLLGATGVGALAGSLALAAKKGVRGLTKIAACSCAGFAISLILFSISRSFWISVLFLMPVGFCFMVTLASTNTLIQIMVPDDLRGRVMAVHVMMFMGMAPFGSLLAGVVAERMGAPSTVAMGAVCCLGGALIFMLRLPKLQQSENI